MVWNCVKGVEGGQSNAEGVALERYSHLYTRLMRLEEVRPVLKNLLALHTSSSRSLKVAEHRSPDGLDHAVLAFTGDG
jgi:hypothetical protein